jgi:hypothetical protein
MSVVIFVSGHRDITVQEFKEHYIPELNKAIKHPYSNFVIGDYYGVDTMAQQYLKNNISDACNRVKVYHMFESPRNNEGFETVGGFTSDVERDSAMTDVSDLDIAWVRENKNGSGTDQNIQRRKAKCNI